MVFVLNIHNYVKNDCDELCKTSFYNNYNFFAFFVLKFWLKPRTCGWQLLIDFDHKTPNAKIIQKTLIRD